jgi:EmrB/QacA subfamily drug resistance transporter
MSENITEKNKKGIFASPYFVMVVLMLGVFMMGIDAFVFSPALVTIVRDFNTSYDWVSWTLTIYLLVSTAIMPLSGKLSDVFGRKRVFIAGVVFFTAGSLLSSLSWDIYSLIAFRGVQAVGAGVILPAALAAMGSVAPPDKRGKMMGAMMAMSSLAMIVGPNIGGYAIQNFGWRAVFYVNIPIGIIAILLGLMFKESYGNAKHHIDVVGAALLGGGLTTLMLGLVRLETLPFTDVTVFPLFAAGLVLGVLLVLFERRTQEPILDIPLVARGDVLSLNLSIMLAFFGGFCVMNFVASFAQLVLNLGIQDSGTILTPLSIAMFVFGLLGGTVTDRFGVKLTLLLSFPLLIAGLLGMTYFATDSLSLAIVLAVIGMGIGSSLSAFQIALMSVTPGKERGTTMGIMMTFRGIGSVVAPVVGGFYLNMAKTDTISYVRAFNDLFLTTAVAAIIAMVLIVYFVLSTRKASRPATPTPHLEIKQ